MYRIYTTPELENSDRNENNVDFIVVLYFCFHVLQPYKMPTAFKTKAKKHRVRNSCDLHPTLIDVRKTGVYLIYLHAVTLWSAT